MDPGTERAVTRLAETLPRIALALERIAAALEAKALTDAEDFGRQLAERLRDRADK